MPYIKANGIKIAFDTYGDMNKKPLFLVPGLCAQRMVFDYLIEELKDDYFLITYDCRGHGQSDHPSEYTMKDHMEDLIALIDSFGYEKVDALGISMGSYIVTGAAIMAPDKFDHIIPGVSNTHSEKGGSATNALLERKGLSIKDVTAEQISEILAAAMFSPNTSDEKRVEINTLMSRSPNFVPMTAEDRAVASKAMIGYDVAETACNIKAKTMVVSAKYDGLNPPEVGKALADLIPGSKFVVMPDSGHMSHCEEPALWAKEIRAFLNT